MIRPFFISCGLCWDFSILIGIVCFVTFPFFVVFIEKPRQLLGIFSVLPNGVNHYQYGGDNYDCDNDPIDFHG
jgi:hypothetical protein